MDLKELEEAGVVLTELEKRLVGNAHFQAIYCNQGLQWPSLAKAILHAELVEGGGLETLKGEPLSPHAIGKICDDHLRPLYVLCATIRRDADLSDSRDRQLISDLYCWLAGNVPQSFQWDRELSKKKEERRLEARKRAIAEQQMDDASLVLLLPTRLTVAEKEELEESLRLYCVSKGLFPADMQYDHPDRMRYFPAARCVFCSARVGSPRYRFAGHGWGSVDNAHPRCNSSNAFTLIDCGNVNNILPAVPTRLTKHIRKARFRIPRSILLLNRFTTDSYVIPQMLIFGLDQLTAEEQSTVYQRLANCLEQAAQNEEKDKALLRHNQGEEESTLLRRTRLFTPTNSRRMDALIIAGIGADEPRDLNLLPWDKALTEGDFGKRLFDQGRITISVVRAIR